MLLMMMMLMLMLMMSLLVLMVVDGDDADYAGAAADGDGGGAVWGWGSARGGSIWTATKAVSRPWAKTSPRPMAPSLAKRSREPYGLTRAAPRPMPSTSSGWELPI